MDDVVETLVKIKCPQLCSTSFSKQFFLPVSQSQYLPSQKYPNQIKNEKIRPIK